MLEEPAQLDGAIQRVQLAARNTIHQTTDENKSKQGKLRYLETHAADACAAVALAMSAMMYEDVGDEFVGIGPAPMHYIAVLGRPDGQNWLAAMGKEVIKIFGMGTWEIVDTSDIYEGSS